MGTTSYAIALVSNRRHGRHGSPAGVIAAALEAMRNAGLHVAAVSAIHRTPAMGGAGRTFANAAALVAADLEPAGVLAILQRIEREFGRRGGKRWGPRVLDLDLLLASEGRALRSRALALPHPGLAARDFVLEPLAEIAPGWRHPRTGLRVRHLRARLAHAKPVDRSRGRP